MFTISYLEMTKVMHTLLRKKLYLYISVLHIYKFWHFLKNANLSGKRGEKKSSIEMQLS